MDRSRARVLRAIWSSDRSFYLHFAEDEESLQIILIGVMNFTEIVDIALDDDVDVPNTDEVLFRLCASTDPQRACPPKSWRWRNSIFTKGPADVLDHATSEIASGNKLRIDATKKLPGEGLKRSWPRLIQDGCSGEGKGEKLFNPYQPT